MIEIRPLSDLRGYALRARDGEIGTLRELYLDDESWAARHLVVRTGSWLRGRLVLVAPRATKRVNERDQTLAVDLSREQVECGPPADAVIPVSRQPWGSPPDPHLRSSEELTGYRIHASDGSIGRVVDLLVDDSRWTVRYLDVDTRDWLPGDWLPGNRVLVAPAWIERVSWETQEVFVNLPCEAVRSAPRHDPSERVGPDDEIELLEHYGMSGQ